MNNCFILLFNDHVQGYINLLRAQITKENNILFRMAGKVLSVNDQQDLLNSIVKVDAPYRS